MLLGNSRQCQAFFLVYLLVVDWCPLNVGDPNCGGQGRLNELGNHAVTTGAAVAKKKGVNPAFKGCWLGMILDSGRLHFAHPAMFNW